MKIGIAGTPKSGKTTLLRLLTQVRGDAPAKGSSVSVGVMEVPDPRVDWLSQLYRPQRTIYARLEVEEVGATKGREFLNAVRDKDAIIVIIPAFMAEGAASVLAAIDDIETEFFIADLAAVEGRLERLNTNKAKPVSQAEVPFLEKCRQALDAGVPVCKVGLEPHEKNLASNFSFLTAKPVILAVNVSADSLVSGEYPGKSELSAKSEAMDYPVVVFSGEVEPEIAELPYDERLAFLKEYGLTEPGVSRIARACYRCLGLISFFTVGEDEVRAWTIAEGTAARQAAGKIHTDLEKGFIRAEVVAYDDLRQQGSMKACREKGLLRLEGKDYVVRDGDILNIRFNV